MPFSYQKLLLRAYSSAQLLLGKYCAVCLRCSNQPLCCDCIASITRPEFSCSSCGWQLPSKTLHNYCKTCIETPSAVESFYSIGTYGGALSQLIIAAKVKKSVAAIAALRYLCRQYMLNDKGTRLYFENHRDYSVVAVPSPKSRMMVRGFNLPRLLATDMSELYTMPLISSQSITLPFWAQKQSRLSKQKRQHNSHFYQINHKIPAKVMVIDDVFTTGKTVRELAKRIRSYGAQNVCVYSIARAQRHV